MREILNASLVGDGEAWTVDTAPEPPESRPAGCARAWRSARARVRGERVRSAARGRGNGFRVLERHVSSHSSRGAGGDAIARSRAKAKTKRRCRRRSGDAS